MQARKNLENCIVNEIHKKLSEKLGEVQWPVGVVREPHQPNFLVYLIRTTEK